MKIGKMISTIEEQKQTNAKLVEENKLLEQRHKEEITRLNEAMTKITEKHSALELEHKKAIKLLKFYQEQETNAINKYEIPKTSETPDLDNRSTNLPAQKGFDNRISLPGGNEAYRTPNTMTDSIKIENQADRSFSRRKKERKLLTFQTGKTLQELSKSQNQELLFQKSPNNGNSPITEVKEKLFEPSNCNDEVKVHDFDIKERTQLNSPSSPQQTQMRDQAKLDSNSDLKISNTFNQIFQKSNAKSLNDCEPKNMPAPIQQQQQSSTIEIIPTKKTEEKVDQAKKEVAAKPLSDTMQKLLLEKQKLDARKEKANQVNEPRKVQGLQQVINEDSDSDDSFYNDNFEIARKVLLNPKLKNTTIKPSVPTKNSGIEEPKNRSSDQHATNLGSVVKPRSQNSALKYVDAVQIVSHNSQARDYSPNIDESDSEITRSDRSTQSQK